MITSFKELDIRQQEDLKIDLGDATEVMKRGGVVIYPTDTIWGIGCDATNPEAVARIYEIKKRKDTKALIILVPEIAWIERYVEKVPDVAWELLEVAVEPLTIVFDKGRNLAPNLLDESGSVGIRVTKELYSSSLCRRLRKPIVSTSVNFSGEPSAPIYSKISPAMIDAADYIAKWRREDDSIARPSSVIKISAGGVFKILR